MGAHHSSIVCPEGHTDIVRLPVEAGGCDTNKDTLFFWLALFYIPCQQGLFAIVRMLVEAGCDTNKAMDNKSHSILRRFPTR